MCIFFYFFCYVPRLIYICSDSTILWIKRGRLAGCSSPWVWFSGIMRREDFVYLFIYFFKPLIMYVVVAFTKCCSRLQRWRSRENLPQQPVFYLLSFKILFLANQIHLFITTVMFYSYIYSILVCYQMCMIVYIKFKLTLRKRKENLLTKL